MVGSLIALSACANPLLGTPAAAVLVNPSEQDRLELSRVVGDALHRPPVLLSPLALTQDSTLVIEPVRPRDANGLPLNGRELGRPEIFRLMKQGSRCLLIRDSTGDRWTLAQSCQPHTQ